MRSTYALLAAPQRDLATMDIRSTLADFTPNRVDVGISEENGVIDQVVSKVKEDLQ